MKEIKVRLEDELHRKLKSKAALAGETLRNYMAKVLSAHAKER